MTYDLSAWSYKPSITIECVTTDNGLELVLTTYGLNSRHPEQSRPFTANRPIAAGLTPEQVRDELLRFITWWENHERDEWARWNGQLINEPHDEYGQAKGQRG